MCCIRLRCRSALVFQSAPQDAACGVLGGLRRFAGATAPPPSLPPSGTHDSRRGFCRGLHTAAKPSTCHTRRGVQAHTREKVRPARPLRRHFREKTRPASPKTPILGCFQRAGRTFLRSHPPSGRAGRTISRTGHGHVATLKPMTPLRPLMQATVKPSSPLLAPEQQPLKPTTPLQPKNTRKTPISPRKGDASFSGGTTCASTGATSRHRYTHPQKTRT